MRWTLGPRKGPYKVPDAVREVLMSQYGLDTRSTEGLFCVESPGWHIGKRVREIRIFDPSLARSGTRAITKYDDLMLYREALLFQGHIERDGSVHLSDWRLPKTKKPLRPTESPN